VTMKIWGGEALPEEGSRHGCYGPGEAEDIEDARKVARTLGIDFYVFDLTQEYQTDVLDYFCHEYLSGRTPNPCLICNRKVKFDALLRKTRESGIEFDYVASGHYARVEYNQSNRRYLLKKARDLGKDQSYFIASLSQEQLGRLLFPIGDYTKEEVRKMAGDFGLSVSHKPESQDFSAGGYASLVAAAPPGPILDKQQNILGEHRGISHYTIGQRKGLDISAREPLYVTDIEPARNAIIVGTQEDVYGDELIASGLNWIAIAAVEQPMKVAARIRHHHRESEAVITPLNGDQVHVKFKEPQMAIAPGQAVVFYQEDVVVGAGTIERAKECVYLSLRGA
ncbi:MAG: tRNA 2-thiouridine(34) synthase MnmA, partial [Chloroflexi bacterium]|nr:tRNA 2-thiouridine(34) synthase MnmA [Chloroflexota bacterium]